MGELKITPGNEMQAREWFAAHIAEFEYSIVESGSRFPDYVLEDENGKRHLVEVELESMSFLLHRHDPGGCDFVLCWLHNAKLSIPIFELSTCTRYDAGEIDQSKIDRLRKRSVRSEASNIAALVRRAAQEFANAERDKFFLCYADDLRAQCEFLDSIMSPRMRLLKSTYGLLTVLRENGVEVKALHPQELFDMLVPKPRASKVGTWDESAGE